MASADEHYHRDEKATGEGGAPTIFPEDMRPRDTTPADAEFPLPMFYPMFLMSWAVMTALELMKPHKAMLRRGLLRELNSSMVGRIIFISHEWLSVTHPDPDGAQLRTLQRFLNRLASGLTSVESDWRTQMLFGTNEKVTGQRWQAALPHCYFWLDYAGVPQPCQTGALPQPYDLDDDSPMSLSDAENLTSFAVRSIPAYVAASSVLLVLSPTVAHSDQAGRICDIPSWRRRGWCRVEAFCAKLSLTRVRILNVIGPAVSAPFCCPVSLVFNPPGLGEFTCCSLGHVLDGQRIPCDKLHLRHVMESLLQAYMDNAWDSGDADRMRFALCHSECWLAGLPGSGALLKPSQGDLESFRAMLRWEEPAGSSAPRCGRMTSKSCWALLHWAAMAGNAAAVRDLIREDDSALHCKAPGIPEFGCAAYSTPLHLACSASSGSFAAAAVLLDARADPSARSELGHTPAHSVAMGGSVTQLRQWLSRFPGSVDNRDAFLGGTPLLFALNSASPCVDRFRVLHQYGADLHAGSSMLGRESIMFSACASFSPDVEVIRDLLEARCPAHEAVQPQNSRWQITYFAAEKLAQLSEWRGREPGHVVEFLSSVRGSTPLHMAIAQNACVEVVRLLLEARASVHHRNRMGRTPLQEAERVYGGEPPALLADLLTGYAALP